ncbi:hypothetical protein [Pseudarthrobacter sp. LMD1-1-1.1]|uniref:hypothetical protein n=1 Tax=Pseudarthrobacter sp. LMD1-1-1.1 TaxID=3135242 RepID=UPI00343B280B
MPEQHGLPAIGWVPAWADLQERGADPIGAGFVVEAGMGQDPAGKEYVAGWPEPDAEKLAGQAAGEPGVRLTLLCADAGAAEGLAPGGLAPVAEQVLLMAPTAGLDAAVELPENSQVALAPMETYDAVEITVFDHPVAKGRIQVRDAFAAVAITELRRGPGKRPSNGACSLRWRRRHSSMAPSTCIWWSIRTLPPPTRHPGGPLRAVW